MFAITELAHALDSLVRVSRRDGHIHMTKHSHVLHRQVNIPHQCHSLCTQLIGAGLLRAISLLTIPMCMCKHTHSVVIVQCDQPVASAPYMLHTLHQPAGIVGLIIQETLGITNIQLDVSGDLTYMYNCVYATAILNSTHCISVCYVPNSWSYNYISKVLFTSPSRYLFSIGFGHVSLI